MLLKLSALRRTCRLRHPIVRETLAELIGTITLVFIGNSAIANNLNSSTASAVNVPLGYATALALAVYVSGGVSGGHVNPAVTLGLCLTGRCDLNRLLPFAVAQFIGAFIGAALTHALFFDLFQMDSDRTNDEFYRIFATYPNDFISTGGAFLDQVLGTALLLFGILAVTDRRNMNVPKGAIPMAVGLVLFGVITCSSSNTGAALNPARDFSPRLYSYAIGYDEAFTAGDNFWWIPLVACFLGAVLGAYVYFFCIELHHAPEDEAKPEYELDADTRRPAPDHHEYQKHARDNAGYEDGYTGRGLPRDRQGGYPSREPPRARRDGYM